MNICLFFEGTGQGVAGKITNVTRLRDLCADEARQKLHLFVRISPMRILTIASVAI